MIVPAWTPVLFHFFMGGHHRRLIPYNVDGPFKQIMMSLFRLAWSSKVQLPLLITVCFMAFDIRLQIEINIFWDQANHRRIPDEPEIVPVLGQPAIAPAAASDVVPASDDNDDNDGEDEDSSDSDNEDGADKKPRRKKKDDDDDVGKGQGQTHSGGGNMPSSSQSGSQPPDRRNNGGGHDYDDDGGHGEVAFIVQFELHERRENDVQNIIKSTLPVNSSTSLNILDKFLLTQQGSPLNDVAQSESQIRLLDTWYKSLDLRPKVCVDELRRNITLTRKPFWAPFCRR